MKKELLLYRYVDGTNDTPFPSIDEQISLTTFTYNAQRMAATPTITSSINFPRCLDNDWDVNVYATYRGERYYIRQIPSSSKDNKSVMYKHDITLYSERFVLENIYLYDVLKNDDTNVIIRCDLKDFTDVINRSLEKSNLPYRISIDDSVANTEKALEVKDIALDKVYLSVALQEIYNQWEIPFYFEGHNIIVKDHSKWIADTVLEYGYDKSLLSIKKENANFRKITRCSGYGSDKNIPFFYPNLSQKGIIDLEPLESNKLLQKSDFIITDMRKFDKKMPLNGNVTYKLKDENKPSLQNGKYNGITFKNIYIGDVYNIPFSFVSERKSTYVDFSFTIRTHEQFSYPTSNNVNFLYDPQDTLPNHLMPILNVLVSVVSSGGSKKSGISPVIEEKEVSLKVEKKADRYNYYITRLFSVSFAVFISKDDKFSTSDIVYNTSVYINLADSEFVKNKEKVAQKGGTIYYAHTKDYKATNVIVSKISAFYNGNNSIDEGWYLNNTKKINLDDIGVYYKGSISDKISGEGFKQVMVSKIPTATNLMPPLYRNTLGNEKFYNAKDNTYLNDDNEYYDFETEWNEVNQNEHIQPFEDIYPTITNIVNADNVPFDEVLEVAFDDNDNNEVDEEGNFLHPYFYVKIPKYSGDFGFNLFDHKIVGGNMQVSFTSGGGSACMFDIMVKTRPNMDNETYEDVINPVLTNGSGQIISGDWQQKTAGNFGSEDDTQQNSEKNSIWLVLKKDDQTFGTTLPDSIGGVVPQKGDKFVLLNIEMPQKYIDSAEELLRKNIIQYMWENNSDKWNFSIDFSRIFLQENPIFVDDLSENAKVRVKYDGIIYDFYVNNYKYEVKSNEALPKITIGLVDTITINRSIAQAIANGVMQGLQSQLNGVAYLGDLNEQFLRKRYDETMPNNMTFEKNVHIDGVLYPKEVNTNNIHSDNYSGEERFDTGFQLNVDEDNISSLVLDRLKVRQKLEVFEFIVNQLKAQGGVLWVTSASMECTNVEEYDTYFRCYFDTKSGSVYNQFELNDLAICQKFGNNTKYYWRKVVGIGNDYIDLSIDDCDANSDTPDIGDVIIQLGNTTNTDRQSAIELSSNGVNSPSFIMYSGIDTFSLLDKEITGIEYKPATYTEDENGNIIKVSDGYPNFFSFGSMYFGLRNGENNFISFQKNEETGNYEMIINAKTKFKGDVVGISDILEETSERVDNMEFLTEALQGSTDILGGLLLTNLIEVRNLAKEVVGGMNGLEGENEKIFLWAGGNLQDAQNGQVPFIINRDGTGQIGKLIIKEEYVDIKQYDENDNYIGYIRIDKDGIHVVNVTVNNGGKENYDERILITANYSEEVNSIKSIQPSSSSYSNGFSGSDEQGDETYYELDDFYEFNAKILSSDNTTTLSFSIPSLTFQYFDTQTNAWVDGSVVLNNANDLSVTISSDDGDEEVLTWTKPNRTSDNNFIYNRKSVTFTNVSKDTKFYISNIKIRLRNTAGNMSKVKFSGTYTASYSTISRMNKTIIAKNGITHKPNQNNYFGYYTSQDNITHFVVKAGDVEIKQSDDVVLTDL